MRRFTLNRAELLDAFCTAAGAPLRPLDFHAAAQGQTLSALSLPSADAGRDALLVLEADRAWVYAPREQRPERGTAPPPPDLWNAPDEALVGSAGCTGDGAAKVRLRVAAGDAARVLANVRADEVTLVADAEGRLVVESGSGRMGLRSRLAE